MKKISYIGVKESGKPFRTINSKMFREELDSLPVGKYRITVEKLKKNKSNQQLAWLYGQIYPHVLHGLICAGWEEIATIEEVDSFCKDRFANRDIVNTETGEVMTVPALKREMSTTEFCTYVEAIRKWGAEYLNINIPDPETNLTMDL